MTTELHGEVSEYWRREGLHWHCYARETAFDPNHNYPPLSDEDRRAAVAYSPDEVASWITDQERAADVRAAPKWQDRRGSRLDDGGAGHAYHRRTAAAGKPTGSLVRTGDRQVVLLDAVPAAGCHENG